VSGGALNSASTPTHEYILITNVAHQVSKYGSSGSKQEFVKNEPDLFTSRWSRKIWIKHVLFYTSLFTV